MADDTNITPSFEIASADASSKPKEKKTRAPRKPKIATQAVADVLVSAPAKKTRGPGKKSVAAVVPPTAAPAAKASVVAKKVAVAKAQPVKRAPRQAATASHNTDGFADLLKLEEENQKLRKALSEKLRAENADLRKKLGLA
jgi:putative transposase